MHREESESSHLTSRSRPHSDPLQHKHPFRTDTMQTESRLKDLYLLSIPSADLVDTHIHTESNPTTEQQNIIDHLQSLTLTHINAINIRNLDINNPIWSNLSRDFLGDVRAVCMKNPRRLNRSEYLDEYRRLTAYSPHYHLEVKAVETQLKVLTRAITKGEVTMTLENTGNPVGVVRVIVVILGWKRDGVDGEWECVEARAARGPEV